MSTGEREAAAASRLMEMTIAHWAGELLLQAAEMSLADQFDCDNPRTAKDLAVEARVSGWRRVPGVARPIVLLARKTVHQLPELTGFRERLAAAATDYFTGRSGEAPRSSPSTSA